MARTIERSERFSDPDVVVTFDKGSTDDTDIGPEQFSQYFSLSRVLLLSLEDSYYQYHLGLMSQGTFKGHAMTYRGFFASLGSRAFWNMLRDIYNPEFAAFCRSVVGLT